MSAKCQLPTEVPITDRLKMQVKSEAKLIFLTIYYRSEQRWVNRGGVALNGEQAAALGAELLDRSGTEYELKSKRKAKQRHDD